MSEFARQFGQGLHDQLRFMGRTVTHRAADHTETAVTAIVGEESQADDEPAMGERAERRVCPAIVRADDATPVMQVNESLLFDGGTWLIAAKPISGNGYVELLLELVSRSEHGARRTMYRRGNVY